MSGTRIVIAGASSLLGAEVKSLLEESRFAAADFRLVDEEIAAGTLTEAGGEAAVIQPVEPESFSKADFVFFTGSAGFTKTNLQGAQASGAVVIDLSGALADSRDATVWFINLAADAAPAFAAEKKLFTVPSAAAIGVASVALAAAKFRPEWFTAIAMQPVSDAGKRGIEELEQQTSQLLSFQPVGHPVFDTQVGFSLLDRFGAASSAKLSDSRERLQRELGAILKGKIPAPAVQVIHAPVFYGAAFSVAAKLASSADAGQLAEALKVAGCTVTAEPAPSNVSVAGEDRVHIAPPLQDGGAPDVWWFWGAADNIRVPARNAVKLAEKRMP